MIGRNGIIRDPFRRDQPSLQSGSVLQTEQYRRLDISYLHFDAALFQCIIFIGNNLCLMIDSDFYGRADEVFNAIWSQLENFKKDHEEIEFENIYYENNIRGFEYYSRHLYFWATVLVALNLIIVSARYSSRNIRVVAVNRMVGVPTAGIIASVASKYALTALTGVAISFITICLLNTNAAFAKSEFAYFATLPIKTVVIVIIIAVLISVLCGIIPVLRILAKKDLSNEVK